MAPFPPTQLAASARTADCSYVSLYVEILNTYLYYFDRAVPPFTPSVLQPIIDLIQGEVSGAAPGMVDESTTR